MIKPIGTKVIVRRNKTITMTESGLAIPKQGQRPSVHGVIAAPGTGIRNAEGQFIPLTVKEGDKVMMQINKGTVINLDAEKGEGEEFLLMDESDLVGVL